MKNISRFLFIFLIFLVFTFSVQALDNTQQYSKIFLNPFYRASMAVGTNYSYNITVNPPDKIGSVINAILSFNAQINGQTQSFSLWINKQPCNPASYSVATAFSTTGNVQFYFDCSEQIKKAGFYNITFSSAVATGAITGWLDLTYKTNATDYVAGVGLVNKCTAVDNVSQVNSVSTVNKVTSVDSVKKVQQTLLDMHGTEYKVGERGTIFVQLKNSEGVGITNGSCYLDIYYPLSNNVHPYTVIDAPMVSAGYDDGLYYYDFIVPPYIGIYMLSSKCAYSYNTINYYPEDELVYYPDLKTQTGTWLGSSYVLNSKTDNEYVRCTNTAGNPCTGNFTYNVSVYGSLGNITNINFYYLGQSSTAGTMTIAYWNGTAFVNTANTLTYVATGASSPTAYDQYYSTALPVSAIINNIVMIRSTDTGSGVWYLFKNWQILSLYTASGTIQDLKGSSELHVTSNTDYEFIVSDFCGDTTSICAKFLYNTAILDEPQGIVVENITFTNYYNGILLSSVYDYETALGLDCTGVLEVNKYINRNKIDIYDTVSFETGTTENCIIGIPVNFNSTVSSYKTEIIFDNYLKWEVNWANDMVRFYNQTISDYCVDLGDASGYTYTVPITFNLTSTNLQLIACHRALDDIYYFNKNYQESLVVDVIGDYESYLSESRFYYPLIRSHYADIKQTVILNMTGEIMNDTGTSLDEIRNKIHLRVWNNTVRNLTYYPTQTDLTDYQKTANYVWNQTSRNLTYYPATATINNTAVAEAVWGWNGTITTNILELIAGKVWEFVGGVAQILT